MRYRHGRMERIQRHSTISNVQAKPSASLHKINQVENVQEEPPSDGTFGLPDDFDHTISEGKDMFSSSEKIRKPLESERKPEPVEIKLKIQPKTEEERQRLERERIMLKGTHTVFEKMKLLS